MAMKFHAINKAILFLAKNSIGSIDKICAFDLLLAQCEQDWEFNAVSFFICRFDCLPYGRIFDINFLSVLKHYWGVFMSIIFFQIVFYTYILMFYQWIYDSRCSGICWAISVVMPIYLNFITLYVWIGILFKIVIFFSTVCWNVCFSNCQWLEILYFSHKQVTHSSQK